MCIDFFTEENFALRQFMLCNNKEILEKFNLPIDCKKRIVELIKNHKLITNSFTIADSSEYSIAAKLTSYISDKFVLIATAGMFGMIIGDFALSQPPVRFYECLFDIYQFIMMLYLLQFVLSMIINKFISRIEQLEFQINTINGDITNEQCIYSLSANRLGKQYDLLNDL